MNPHGRATAEVPGPDEPVISIGVFAERVGLSTSAIRRYETEGLLLAHRTPSGHRLYSQQDFRRVEVIQHLIRDLGLNFEGIRRMEAMLPCWRLLDCDPGTRQACPAYRDTTRPCWTNKPVQCREEERVCRNCVAYRLGSLCAKDVKHLTHPPSECTSGDAVVCSLLERMREPTEHS
ncbi:MAG: MerR family transcriptional regulator [Gemmatimonadota bacterium]|jgi:hypothetical protein